jgi:membrane protease subunit (stomatin/prohibitin family)
MAIVDVIKYEGTPDVFAWKYPNEEISTWSQLIVSESQEAVLFKDGRAYDVFSSGRYTLETKNIPLLNQVINLPFGGKSPFSAEVWFVNKVYSLDIKWGTPTPIQFQDPKYKVFVPIRSYGQFGVQIEDAKKFLIKLVGTLTVFDKTNLVRYLRGLYLARAKDAISSFLLRRQMSVLEINAYLDEISDDLEEKLQPILSEYGIKLLNFYVNEISVPEDDASVIQLKNALAKRAEMDIVGYSYQQERSFDTLENAAKNQGSGGDFMGMGVGLGAGVSMGGAFGGAFGELSKNISVAASGGEKVRQYVCPECHALINGKTKFCPECGHKMSE